MLNPLLRKRLEKHKVQNPALTVDPIRHWDRLQRLNDLAEQISNPGARSKPDIWTGVGVKVGNVGLHQLSLGAYLWATEQAIKWFKDGSFWQDMAIVYAMAYTRRPSHLRRIRSKGECKAALKMWMRNCSATSNELVDAVQTLCGEQEADTGTGEGESVQEEYGPTIALLCREYHGNPEYWMWKANIEQVKSLLLEYDAKIRAENKAQSAANGASGGMAPNPHDPYIQANQRLQAEWQIFVKEVEADNGE